LDKVCSNIVKKAETKKPFPLGKGFDISIEN